MANELRLLNATSGVSVYAVISRDSDDQVWNGTTYETRVNANQSLYAVALTETPSGSRIWLGNMPSAISNGTLLNVDYYQQASVSPVYTDTILGGESMYSDGSIDSGTPATTSLISISEYDAVVSNTYSASAKTFLIAAATSAIEKYCQRKLVQVIGRTEVLDGNGMGYVQLGGIPTSVTSVTLDYQSDSETVIDGSNFGWTSAGLLYVLPSATDLSYIPCGFQSVKVIYTTSGTVSYDVKQACVLTVNSLVRKSDADILVTEKSVGQVKVKWNGPEVGADAIPDDAKSLLAPYRNLFVL